MRPFSSLALMLVAACNAQAQTPSLPTLKMETVAVPIVTARCWSPGLAPNARGGWTYVAEFMNYRTNTGKYEKETVQLPTGRHFLAYKDKKARPEAEWLIADLDKGTYKLVNWPGFHAPLTSACLAENGRLFFSVDHGHIYYYDLAADTVRPLARICDDLTKLRFFYKLQGGPDGMIYGSAQSTSGRTSLLRLNPDTLEYKYYENVGLAGRRELTYGYYLAVDPPWMYVAVGQGNWELFAVNADTGETKCLADVQGDGTRISVDQKNGLCTADVSTPTKKESFWLVDGQAVPQTGAAPVREKQYPKVQWKNTKPMDISKPPELNKERTADVGGDKGEGEIVWRLNGSAGEWKTLRFAIKNAEPVRIESLLALPDGSLLGDAQQYQGFFRYYPATKKLDIVPKHGPSGIRSVVYEGKVWFDGYPNVGLLVYDPAQPWSSKKAEPLPEGAAKVNPTFVGYFGQGTTEAHHCQFLLAPGNGRIYICGQRERWSTGTGLGYYDIATGRKFGLGTANKEFEPAGFIALPKISRMVLSGQGKTPNKLIVYDLDLNELERIELAPGLTNTGALFNADADGKFIGCYADPQTKAGTLYLYDLAAKKMEKKIAVPGEAAVIRRPSDGAFWIISADTLSALDPGTLATRPIGRFERGIEYPTWTGKDLFGAAGGELVRVMLPN